MRPSRPRDGFRRAHHLGGHSPSVAWAAGCVPGHAAASLAIERRLRHRTSVHWRIKMPVGPKLARFNSDSSPAIGAQRVSAPRHHRREQLNPCAQSPQYISKPTLRGATDGLLSARNRHCERGFVVNLGKRRCLRTPFELAHHGTLRAALVTTPARPGLRQACAMVRASARCAGDNKGPGEQFYTDAGRSTSASFPDHGGCHARFTTLPR